MNSLSLRQPGLGSPQQQETPLPGTMLSDQPRLEGWPGSAAVGRPSAVGARPSSVCFLSFSSRFIVGRHPPNTVSCPLTALALAVREQRPLACRPLSHMPQPCRMPGLTRRGSGSLASARV